MTEAERIAIENANSAFDQWRDFQGIEDAIASYFDNLQDTLGECGLLHEWDAARIAFDRRVQQLRLTDAKAA